ncbi:MAG: hypothetical protein DWQ05_14190 [Calditrichaeota bacterium]|nr:MAG: hypothetical protein DWQ05_14190 [Calditrichota bacterium]
MDNLKIVNNPLAEKLLGEARSNVQNSDSAKAEKATRQFETIFANMLFSAMRKAMAPEGFYGSGPQGDIFQSMMEQRFGEIVAKRNQLGIADLLKQQLDVSSGNPETGKISDKQLQKIVDEAAAHTGLDPDLIKAVITQESGGNPLAISTAGAKGMMQLMDETARDLQVENVFDSRENIFAGSRYLKQQLDDFGSLELALAAYNAGPSAVKKYGGIPPYEETQNYVKRVMHILQREKGTD